MALKTSISLLVLAALAPWLYDRYLGLSNTIANRPGKLQSVYNIKSHEVKFQNVVRNCEDVIIDEGMGIAFLSCDPGRDRWNTVMGTFHKPFGHADKDSGRIWIYDYSAAGLADSKALWPLSLIDFSDPPDLHPLGIEFDAATSTLYVINHSRHSGSVIEIFKVDFSNKSAKHVKTFKHALIHTPNSITLLGNGKLYVTNDHYVGAAVSPLLSKIETFSGIPGGTVVYTDVRKPEDTRVVARVPFANGIIRLNTTTLAVASSSKPGVYLYTINDDHSLLQQTYIRTPAGADNLSVDSNGKLLIAGHPFAPSLMKVSEGRAECDMQGSEAEKAKCVCNAPSWVAEWSEEGGLREMYKDSGDGDKSFCTSSTAVRDVGRGLGIVSGLYERGIMVFKE